jgi:hypothetical protein
MADIIIVKPYTVVTRCPITQDVNRYGADKLREAQHAMQAFKASGLNAYISDTLATTHGAYIAGF